MMLLELVSGRRDHAGTPVWAATSRSGPRPRWCSVGPASAAERGVEADNGAGSGGVATRGREARVEIPRAVLHERLVHAMKETASKRAYVDYLPIQIDC
jgi:hypothetical protein